VRERVVVRVGDERLTHARGDQLADVVVAQVERHGD
jgi:hypothetical protein